MARPWRVVLLFTVLALVGTVMAARLEFRGSFVELLPQEAPEVQDLTRVAEKAGGDGYLVVRAQGDKPEALRAFSDVLARKLEALPEVRYVEHHFDVGFFEERGLLLMPAEKLAELRQDVDARLRFEKEKAIAVDLLDDSEKDAPPDFDAIVKKYSPDAPMREYLGSADGAEVYLMVKPGGTAGDLVFAQRLVDDVQRVADEVSQGWPDVKLDYAGAFQARLEEDKVMRADLSRAAILSAVMAVAIILLATRRLWALAVVGVPVVFGVSLTFAVAELAIGHLNVVTGFLVAILIGLGLEYGIHLSMRYWEERREHPVAEALANTVRGTFSGALTSALTNAAAFFVLLFAQFDAFKQFGLLAGVGVLMAVVVAYGLGPALLVLAERLRPGGGKAATAAHAPTAPEQATPRLPGKRMPTPVVLTLLLSVLGFAAYSAYVMPRVGFETNLRSLKGDSPTMRVDDHITQQLGASLNPAILLVDDLKQAQVVQEVIAEVKGRHGAGSVFKQSASLNDLLPQDVAARTEQIAALRQTLEKLPESAREDPRLAKVTKMLEAQPYGAEQVPVEMRRRFEALDGQGMFLLLFPSVGNHDTRELSAWASQLDEVVAGAKARGVNLAVLDSNRIAARIFSMVRADGPFILWAAASVVFLTILISLRSFKRACLVAGPLFLGMLCLAGGMYLFDIQLNFINAVVLPNLLAIAVDNSVHLFHRYEEEGPGSLGHVVRHTGLAAVVATLSNAAGYGALLISHHAGLKSIGQIALLGVMCTFLGTTVFFPAMLALLERWKGRDKEGGTVRSLDIGKPGEAVTEPGERKSA